MHCARADRQESAGHAAACMSLHSSRKSSVVLSDFYQGAHKMADMQAGSSIKASCQHACTDAIVVGKQTCTDVVGAVYGDARTTEGHGVPAGERAVQSARYGTRCVEVASTLNAYSTAS